MPVFDRKTTEMIALSASVAANCVPCTQYHLEQAQKQGFTKEEITEIITVAKMVKQRPTNEVDETIANFLGVKQKGCCAKDCRSLGKD